MGSRILIHNLGYPRMGAQRQLKRSLEAYWSGRETETALRQTGAALRRAHCLAQQKAGVDWIPSNDFSFYDHVLDTIAMVGAVPERFGWNGGQVDLPTYFAMARGQAGSSSHDSACSCNHTGAHALEMTKWFDTNYHYLVPEFQQNQKFSFASTKPIDEFQEALALGITTKPVLLGPVTFLKLGKVDDPAFNRFDLLDPLIDIYIDVLHRLAAVKAEWIQLDEPVFALDLTEAERSALSHTYQRLRNAVPDLKLMVATYFNDLDENLDSFAQLPVHALHFDAYRSESELGSLLSRIHPEKIVSLGLVDGRNVWRNDYAHSLALIQKAVSGLREDRIWIAPTCSLLHTPHSLQFEEKLHPEIKSWLAFTNEKLIELSDLRKIREGDVSLLNKNREIHASRRSSILVHHAEVKSRAQSVAKSDLKRKNPYSVRQKIQRDHLSLPILPTTTIGSFPQTEQVRKIRALHRKGKINQNEYDRFLEEETRKTIEWQDRIGLDVLVHGEFERTDMVEYFGEQLNGFAFTENGWVQSYGSRCVKPPLLFGDVDRPKPMTVRWSQFAQAQTKKPMKGMLTGPITILQWSFVRNDQHRSETARQIALAIRDEVRDLEAAGLSIIQVDEPALREGLPLRRKNWPEYLRWSVDAFRLATSVVADRTQIHTHMCYCDFDDILESIAELDADVISIESSRSEMTLLKSFRTFAYPNEIGPGVYDIHSPRVPPIEEMTILLEKALQVLPIERVWVNPDCGLKTRQWPEVEEALRNMVKAAQSVRSKRN